MKDYSNQKAEIATIKKRNISISLSDADCERLAIKAGTVGLTVDELLSNFIGDLVDGTYSNGSDERMYANDWYERCGFSFAPEETLLNFLLSSYSRYAEYEDSSVCDEIKEVGYLLTYYDEIQTLKSSIAYAKEFPEDCENNIQSLKEDLEDYLIDYHCCVDEFLEKHPDADIEKEILLCRKWLEEYEKIAKTE
ncbi:MAG: molecular chaperone GrpE [Acutalibacteraceae bacterium]|nr:molecular chaperone GrpE [Acutalibacteraceae bacterium]MEE1153833.1 molecular chaperone GrpE [Acutalibacteraceae bacterium]